MERELAEFSIVFTIHHVPTREIVRRAVGLQADAGVVNRIWEIDGRVAKLHSSKVTPASPEGMPAPRPSAVTCFDALCRLGYTLTFIHGVKKNQQKAATEGSMEAAFPNS